jgi:hypothetical protein
MPYWKLSAVAAVLLFLGPTSRAAKAAESVRLALTADRQEYLIGLPVGLRLTLSNGSRLALEAIKPEIGPALEPQLLIYVSADGKSFKQFVAGYRTVRVEEEFENFAPGANWVFDLTIYFTNRPRRALEKDRLRDEQRYFGGPEGLAFQQEGIYFVKVKYPLRIRGEPPKFIDSNVVEVKIQQPQGLEAKIAERLQVPEFMDFVQGGRLRYQEPAERKNEKMLVSMVQILEDYADSRYHAFLRQSLRTMWRLHSHFLDLSVSERKRVTAALRLD